MRRAEIDKIGGHGRRPAGAAGADARGETIVQPTTMSVLGLGADGVAGHADDDGHLRSGRAGPGGVPAARGEGGLPHARVRHRGHARRPADRSGAGDGQGQRRRARAQRALRHDLHRAGHGPCRRALQALHDRQQRRQGRRQRRHGDARRHAHRRPAPARRSRAYRRRRSCRRQRGWSSTSSRACGRDA